MLPTVRHIARVPLISSPSLRALSVARMLNRTNMNAQVIKAEYAVRGEMVLRSMQLAKTLRTTPGALPFDKIVLCNIGNPQSLGQKPITVFREVLALCNCPHLLKHPEVGKMFSRSAIQRATELVEHIPGGTGAYSNSQGIDFVREQVARFISTRDGAPASADDIFLTDGASPAVQMMLRLVIRDGNDGVMIPIPQYPLYSASIALCGGKQVGYYLDEEEGWGLDIAELRRSAELAEREGVHVRALAVINPGNPTGQCLTEANMREIIKFCQEKHVVLLADEVYQENIWNDARPFVSFKRVLRSMGAEYQNVQLASFHSISKGFLGECGRRGGYVELTNMDPDVHTQVYKLASVNLCSNVEGQITVGLMAQPPVPGDDAHAQYVAERDGILASLRRRARKLVEAFGRMEGVSCAHTDASMYVFPRILLPPRAVEAAAAAGKAPDTLYCLQLLDSTGIVVVPGSGFGQMDGTYHFRTTILPPEEELDAVIARMTDFHARFMAQYK